MITGDVILYNNTMPLRDFKYETGAAVESTVLEMWAHVSEDSIPYLAAGHTGRNVLLVHGAGASRRDWKDVIPVLAQFNRVYAPDLIGFGDAPRRELSYTPEYMADSLVGFMDGVGIEDAILVGHSLGGRVCLEVARKYPERVRGLTLEAPMGFGKLKWTGRLFGILRWWIYEALGFDSPYPRLDFPTVESDTETFDSITCETLLMWGSKDLYFPPEQGIKALEMIPNSRLRIYDGVGHSVHRSIPERFNSDLCLFLVEQS